MKKLLVLPIAALVALSVVTAYAAWDRGGVDEGTSASAMPSEGIDVHGDWRIAIYNEDGSLDQEYAFSNALRPGAGSLLGQLLVFDNSDLLNPYPSVFDWAIVFGKTGSLLPDPVPGEGPCTYSLAADVVPGHNPTLLTACALGGVFGLIGPPGDGIVETSQIDGGIRIEGAAVATQAGSIDYVETWLLVENGPPGGGLPPLPDLAMNAMTGTDVGPFENIQAGQTIQVEVEITFATPAP